MMRSVYLIDGSNLLYRAYHAIRGFRTSKGFPTNAAFGILNMLFSLKKTHKPDMVIAVFDPPGPTAKHAINPQYKANREKTPDDLIAQIPYVHRAIKSLGVPVVIVPGQEADDVIGTLAHKFVTLGDQVTIVTGDKDFCQLVGPNVRLLDTMKDKITDNPVCVERLGIPPEKVVDYLAICGDAVDNLPGVNGIGPKGAVKLLADYGSIEGVLEHLDEIGGKKAEAIREAREKLFENRKMMTIDKNLELDLQAISSAYGVEDRDAAAEVFRELEFTKFLKDLDLASRSEVKQEVAPSGDVAVNQTWLAVHCREGEACTFTTFDGHAFVNHQQSQLVELGQRPVVGHGLKNSRQMLQALGITGERLVFDTEIAAYLLDPGRRSYAVEIIAGECDVPHDEGNPGEEILKIASILERRIAEKGMERIFNEVEMPLVGLLSDMEKVGVKVDKVKLKELSDEFAGRILALEQEIFLEAGEEFNPQSPKQLSQILFEKLKLPVIRKTATGVSTDASVLEELKNYHNLPGLLLDHRSLTKLKNSFLDTLPTLIDPADGRIHTSFNQTVAATGRLSSSNPNLQNIPVRGLEGKRIREAFIAEPGYELVSADYSQIEIRVLAHLSQDKALIDMFRSGRDIHSETAGRLFGVGPFGITSDMRRQAKTVNFGIIYGISPFGLAKQLGVTRQEAGKMIDAYFKAFPGVDAYMKSLIDEAQKTGESRTLMGRVRKIPGINSSNKNEREAAQRLAVNSPLQGTAADVIKVAMLNSVKALKGLPATLILQVHDELVFEVEEGNCREVLEIVKNTMETAVEMDVRLEVDARSGQNWFLAHE